MYGPSLVDVGGKVEGDAGAEVDPGPKGHDLVQVSWHSKPPEFYEETMHSYNITSWWDLTAADVVLPLLAVRKKFPYLGVRHTTEHRDALEQECIERMFKAMQDPHDSLYVTT